MLKISRFRIEKMQALGVIWSIFLSHNIIRGVITCQKTRGHKEEHQVLMVLKETIHQFRILIFYVAIVKKKCPILVNVSTIPESVYSRVTSGQALCT